VLWLVLAVVSEGGLSTQAVLGGPTDPRNRDATYGAVEVYESNAMVDPMAIDFAANIVPILTRAGCNAADCHGGAAGRGGFRLSLFGGDPELDYRSIALELEQRRVDLLIPEQSLVLAKPTELLEHGGGRRLDSESSAVATIVRWIANGASDQRIRSLVRLEIEPQRVRTETLPQKIPLTIIAHYSDGTQKDVRDLAVYTSTDDTAARIEDDGTLMIHRPGMHAVMVRLANRVVAVPIEASYADPPSDVNAIRPNNFIDEQIFATLDRLRVPRAALCDDATYLRRITLDLTGRLPDIEHVRQFMQSDELGKREQELQRLLDSQAFLDYWTMQLALMLRMDSVTTDVAGVTALHAWLHDQLTQDRPWNEIVRELLLAEGDSQTVGPAYFHRLVPDARAQAEYVSETLMGVRLACANCHNHPLDRWTQDDYHGLAQIMAPIQRGSVVRLEGNGPLIHPRTGKFAVAKLPGMSLETQLAGEDVADLRTFASWLTARDNPYFARAFVNRVWQRLMRLGLVDPVVDHRVTNPPSHPQLLQELTEYFDAHQMELRPLIRVICESASYQRSGIGAEAVNLPDRYYASAPRRPLSAPVLLDAVSDVTGLKTWMQPADPSARVATMIDRRSAAASLQAFGACPKGQACSTREGGIDQLASQLALLNGEVLNRPIADSNGRLAMLLHDNVPPVEIVAEFYLRALGREVRESELDFWHRELSDTMETAELREKLEDFVWSLLNSSEFVNNR
ncbi:MAG: DUF1553 domain-containing protein, partial [Planctomycetales bacterium]|nr:DUF1553 domain-containing protein [Planctomycetales bacterium]